ncbi:hypothetical protein [Oricola thermophila]|uniref:DUF3426 domain-containing protein n=1 Tax=Oricola thermophila TaxID=2742145 RepID=A0A6N1VGT2_9HYPH|nr:hypothetical protein [Oricola thermophila]QKV20126.1 hypothetical protein HTY61_17570 [Oricola thermophila]
MAKDIIDAEFETIHRDDGKHPMRAALAASSANQRKPAPKPKSVAAPGIAVARQKAAEKAAAPEKDGDDDQIGILKSGEKDAAPSRKAQILYALSVLFSAFFAFYISGGHVLFHALPAAQEGNPLALELTPAPPEPATGLTADVVTVSATIRNGSTDVARVPDVLLSFAPGGEGRTLVYRVPRGETLEPGKSLAFTVRMPKKPGYAESPRLTFDNSGV